MFNDSTFRIVCSDHLQENEDCILPPWKGSNLSCFSSSNPSLDTPEMTGLFSSAAPRIWNSLYHFILDPVFITTTFKFLLKTLCHRFSTSITILLGLFSLVLFWMFYCVLNTQQGGYMCTLQIFIIIFIKLRSNFPIGGGQMQGVRSARGSLSTTGYGKTRRHCKIDR